MRGVVASLPSPHKEQVQAEIDVFDQHVSYMVPPLLRKSLSAFLTLRNRTPDNLTISYSEIECYMRLHNLYFTSDEVSLIVTMDTTYLNTQRGR